MVESSGSGAFEPTLRNIIE
jgi:arsenite/tail-anchored protein-transporting ATPase